MGKDEKGKEVTGKGGRGGTHFWTEDGDMLELGCDAVVIEVSKSLLHSTG